MIVMKFSVSADKTDVNSQLHTYTNIAVIINNVPLFPLLPSICVISHIFQKVFVYFFNRVYTISFRDTGGDTFQLKQKANYKLQYICKMKMFL